MAARIGAVGITVKNMAASLRFYRMLGLPIPEGLEKESHVDLVTDNGYRLMWDTIELARQVDPKWTPPSGQGITLAFELSSPGDVNRKYQELIAAGYKGYKNPWDAFWGQRYAIVLDPDGYKVDLFAAN